MKKMTRYLAVGAVSLCLLAGVGYALAPEDSLVTLKYVLEQFIPSAEKAGKETGEQMLQESYDAQKGILDQTQKDLLMQATGGSGLLSSATLSPMTFRDGEIVEMTTGTGFLMLDGTAVVNHDGAVIDVNEGKEVPNGTKLLKNHRYLVGEDTSAMVATLSGAATMGIQGEYKRSGGEENPMPFYDVSHLDWNYDHIKFVYDNGFFNGISDHEFGPALPMNRAMVMTVFYRLAGSPEGEMQAAEGVSFRDVSETAWYAPFVKWASSKGITAGYDDGRFGPDDLISREQFTQMLYSFSIRYLGKELSGQGDVSIFKDAGDVDAWAAEAVSWAVANGILTSTSQTEQILQPRADAGRASVAVMLKSYSDLVLQ